MHIVLMVLAFIWWWPVGLAVLAFLIAKRRFGRHALVAGDGQMWGCNPNMGRWEHKMERAQARMDRVRQRMEAAGRAGWFSNPIGGSGNHAFDEYRAETLKRLEEEQNEFKDFLGRLRVAKDRAEFDQFMNSRRPRPTEPEAPSEPQN